MSLGSAGLHGAAIARRLLGARLGSPVGILDRLELFELARRALALSTSRLAFINALADHPEVDLSPVEIDTAHLNPNAPAHDVAHTGALAAKLLARLVEAVVLAAELGD